MELGDFDKELKKITVQKDIFALQGAEMEQKKLFLQARKMLADSESKMKEYQARIDEKKFELMQLEE
jgi:hypothetical protein